MHKAHNKSSRQKVRETRHEARKSPRMGCDSGRVQILRNPASIPCVFRSGRQTGSPTQQGRHRPHAGPAAQVAPHTSVIDGAGCSAPLVDGRYSAGSLLVIRSVDFPRLGTQIRTLSRRIRDLASVKHRNYIGSCRVRGASGALGRQFSSSFMRRSCFG